MTKRIIPKSARSPASHPENARTSPARARPAYPEPAAASRGLAEAIVRKRIGDLRPFPNNPRRHPESQIASLMKNIKRIWTNPILIDESGTILAGHGRLEAARRLAEPVEEEAAPVDDAELQVLRRFAPRLLKSLNQK